MDSAKGNPPGRGIGTFWRLVRAPNLLSVPGDPLAGGFLALASSDGAHATVPWCALLACALASVSAYAGGMIDNDLADLEEDRRERPERPLPSGAVRLATARAWRTALLGWPLALGGWALPLAWAGVYAALLASVLAYNRVKRHARFPGFLLMGLCRGLSLLAGAAVLGPTGLRAGPVWVAAGVWTAYIAGVTAFASTENRRGPGARRFLLLGPHLAALAVGLARMTPRLLPGGLALAMAGLAGLIATGHALKSCGPQAEPAVLRPTVGRLIRVLFPMQAFACLGSAPSETAPLFALLLVGWFASARLSRRIAAS